MNIEKIFLFGFNFMNVKLSLVIPSYNEEKNLPILINQCRELTQSCAAEVIIVDNGSTDNTQQVLKKLIKPKDRIRTVSIKKNIGYGHGIISGLSVAKGEILGWTHGDTQTNPIDALKGLNIFMNSSNPKGLFVKGLRQKRDLGSMFFTFGMTVVEFFLLKRIMTDINAQPTMFHRSFYTTWTKPPYDYSLDLYAFYKSRITKLKEKRFPVYFTDRKNGKSHWNLSFRHKIKFIAKILRYSFHLKNNMIDM